MFSEETQKEIMRLFKDDKETAKKLLEGDGETIRGLVLGIEILPSEVIDAYENNKMKEIYEKAKSIEEKRKLYFRIINEHACNYTKKI